MSTEKRQRDPRLFTILLIVFVQMVGASMAFPVLPLYAKNEFGMDDRVIPLLISAFFAAQFVAGPTIGRLSDQYGRVPILIISQIGTAIAFLAIGLSNTVWLLFVSRIFDGITGGNIIVAQAYVTDITPPEERTTALGFIFAAFGVGFVVGPALGGILSGYFGPRAPFLIAALAAAIVVLLTWRTLDETISAEQRALNRANKSRDLTLRKIFQNQTLITVLIIAFLLQFAFGLLQGVFSLWGEAVLFQSYTERATFLGIGLILSFVGIGQIIAQTALLPRLVKRYSERTIVIAGIIIRIFGLIYFALLTNPWLGPIGSITLALGLGISVPPLQSIATKAVSDNLRGEALGVFTSTANLAIIFSTALTGVLFSLNPTFPFWVGAGLTAFTLGLILLNGQKG